MTYPNKKLIRNRFNKNLKTYETEARAQKLISAFLAEKTAMLLHKTYHSILEIGCGSGFLTKEICQRLAPSNLYLNDLYYDAYETSLRYSQEVNKAHHLFIEGDAENANFPDKIDGILSSSCFQWFNHLDGFLSKAHTLLNKNGVLAFSTFGEQHFTEIKQITGIGLNFYPLAELDAMVGQKYKVLFSHEWIHLEHFSSPLKVLKHMKHTGVNGMGGGYFGKEKLNDFTQKYWQFYSEEPNKVCLTYHPIVVIAQKRDIS